LNDDVEVPGRLLELELLVFVLREGDRAVDTEPDGRLEVERCRS
jgi:hypothetical protein